MPTNKHPKTNEEIREEFTMFFKKMPYFPATDRYPDQQIADRWLSHFSARMSWLEEEIESRKSFPAEMFQLNNLKMPFIVYEGKADEKEKCTIFELGFKDALNQVLSLLQQFKDKQK